MYTYTPILRTEALNRQNYILNPSLKLHRNTVSLNIVKFKHPSKIISLTAVRKGSTISIDTNGLYNSPLCTLIHKTFL